MKMVANRGSLALVGSILLASALAQAQTNVVVNGSFESSSTALTGWTAALGTGSVSATCAFNAAVAPGTETVTGEAGLPATNGSNIALGSSHDNASGSGSCVLYQDVAIPANATAATFSFDWGIIYDGVWYGNAALFAGIYPTSSVPTYFSSALSGTLAVYEPSSNSTALTHESVTLTNVPSLSGTTVRLAMIIGQDNNVGTAAVGVFDNIQLQVTASAPVTAVATPTLGQWGMIGLGGLLLLCGCWWLARRGDASASV